MVDGGDARRGGGKKEMTGGTGVEMSWDEPREEPEDEPEESTPGRR